jgi:hypothetical protein
MLPVGLERPQDSTGKTAIPENSAANSGAVLADSDPSGDPAEQPAERSEAPATDAQLHVVIDAWPKLSEPLRAGILALVRVSQNQGADAP